MKAKLIYLVIFILLGCGEFTTNEYYNGPLQLRQMVNDEKTETSGSFFLIIGNYSKIEEVTIKVFVNAEGYYRFIEMSMEQVRIKIDNTISKPYLLLKYNSSDKRKTSDVLDYEFCIYIIHCPEHYLPENLTPINLKRR